jgi:hypothetical protein
MRWPAASAYHLSLPLGCSLGCGRPHERASISRQGARVERGIVRALQAEGFAATRVPLSGAAGGRFAATW